MRSGRRPGRGRGAARWAVVGVPLLAISLAALPLAAQEPEPAGAPPDTVAGDTVAAPGAVFPTPGARRPDAPARPAGEEPGAARGRQAYPAPVVLPAPGALAAYEWDLRDQLASGAVSLLDLLTEALPGFTAVRASYYAGPHHLVDGVLGAGFVRVRVDGRELLPLDGGQVDLTRISLTPLERVRAARHVDGWTIDLTTLRHDRPDAYSRIAAGTGQPGFEQLQGAFTNGFGSALTLGVAMDLLNIDAGELPSDRFDFWGKVSWMPVDGGAGVELQYRTESMNRTVLASEELDRREAFLHARGELARGVQGSLFAGTTEIRSADEMRARSRHAGLALAGNRGQGFARVGFEVADERFLPSVAGEVTLGARLLPALAAEVTARGESWRDFRSGGVRGAVRWEPDLGLGVAFAAAGATGLRGVAVPSAGAADSVSYDLAEVAGEGALGPFRVGERIGWQRLGGRPPLGPPLDPPGARGGRSELQFFETTVAGPVLPLGWLVRGLAPLRVRGTWRYGRILSGEFPAFLPENVVRGEVFLRDEFFGGNLEVRAAVGLDRRTEMFAPFGEGPDAGLAVVPGWTTYNWNLLIRIDTVRIWWRVDNLSGVEASDVPGLAFPTVRNAFGLRWEFFN